MLTELKTTSAYLKVTMALSNVKEYEITDLGIKYTPNIVQKTISNLINGIKAILSPIELQSDPIYKHLNRTGNNRVNAIKTFI